MATNGVQSGIHQYKRPIPPQLMQCITQRGGSGALVSAVPLIRVCTAVMQFVPPRHELVEGDNFFP